MANSTCCIPDCERQRRARGLCTLHYQRWQRHGGPAALKPQTGPRTDPISRFWSKVQFSSANDCWVWVGGRDRDGYGNFKVNRRMWRAHRYSFDLAHPDALISQDEMVLHTCDNPPCVNPAHLKRGDAADNMADQIERKRTVRGRKRPDVAELRGSKNRAAKLTEYQVIEIRKRYAAGEKQVPLAHAFGVSQITISLIVRRKTWTHLKE